MNTNKLIISSVFVDITLPGPPRPSTHQSSQNILETHSQLRISQNMILTCVFCFFNGMIYLMARLCYAWHIYKSTPVLILSFFKFSKLME